MRWLPVPFDNIIGLFHPWRDFFGNLPFKNFIITDPVRQQIPWRELAIDQLKHFQLPLWNPYNFAGTPLLANIQSAVFYPLNFLFFIFNFPTAWAIYIYLSVILGFLFMYLYLRNLKLENFAAVFGAVTFALSGFNIAWLENGVLTHTLMWLPLILYAIDKKKSWLYLISLLFSFYAGHWQTFFYIFLVSQIYLLLKKQFKFLVLSFVFLVLSLPQLLPSLQFINLSARASDQIWSNTTGWFIPWQNLIQFISADYFGNPSTLNYSGIFSYQEFVGYVGIAGLIAAISAVFIKRKIIWFFAGISVLSLLFALPTPLAKAPFVLNLPLISSSMPTRLLSLVDFSLAVLAAFGISKINTKVLIGFAIALGSLWAIAMSKYLIIPTVLLVLIWLFRNKPKLLIIILVVDLGFFAYKFLPFSEEKNYFPNTKLVGFLQSKTKDYPWRFMTTSDEIFPPNFNIVYRLQTINGYDPLYLKSYSDLVGGGNRIIVPKDYKSSVINTLGVKYILSFDDLPKEYPLVFQEGKTKVYENPYVLPRASGDSRFISYQPNRVVIETKASSAETLILSDMNYPGWQVYVDGVLSKIVPTQYNFRSVQVPAGKHEVVFEYNFLSSFQDTQY